MVSKVLEKVPQQRVSFILLFFSRAVQKKSEGKKGSYFYIWVLYFISK